MKRIVLGLLMSLIITAGYGQYGVIVDYKKETWSEVKNNKLYIVYEEGGSSSYDKSLKEALTANWNFSEVEYIKYEKYEELQKIETNFFLISVDFTATQAGKYNESLSYMYIIRGYKKGAKKGAKKGDISRFPQLAAIQTGDISRETYLPVLIKHLNKSVEEVMSGKITSLGDNTKQLNSNKSKIKSKTLYLLETDLNDKITSEEDLKADYVGQVKVISQEELSNKIKAGEDVHILFCARSSTKSYLHVYNAKTGEEYYNSSNMVTKKWPAGIIPYHYKKWNK
jgi:hypothetical protein